MSSAGKLAFTGSLFTLPLALLGAVLTLAGWCMRRWGIHRPASSAT
ncbi:MAG: hypothetical protein ACRD1K_18570 [Acidimicrobiales bacterium]